MQTTKCFIQPITASPRGIFKNELHPLTAIADPNIALLLIALAALGICAEFCSPGRILPGVAGSTLGLLGLTSLAANPIDWRGAVLITLAFIAFALEAKLVTRGVLTAVGALALFAGFAMLAPGIHSGAAAAAAIPLAAIASFLFSVAQQARRNKMIFRTPVAILEDRGNPSPL